MSQERHPGREQALPERLVCHWRKRRRESSVSITAKRPRGHRKGWAQHSSQQSQPPALGEFGGIILDISMAAAAEGAGSRATGGGGEQSLPRGHRGTVTARWPRAH